MAAIDKLYLNSWEQYTKFRDWLKSCGEVTDDFGNKFTPIYELWEYNEVDFDNNTWRPVSSFPTHIDIWLIRNCPLDYIQEGLEEQYTDSYQDIKDGVSDYDTYKRNGLGKNIKVRLQDMPCTRDISRDSYGKQCWTYLDVRFPDDEFVHYHGGNDVWASYYDMRNRCNHGCVSSEFGKRGYMSRKAIYRKLQKWNLPEGATVRVTYECIDRIDNCRYCCDETVTIKRRDK